VGKLGAVGRIGKGSFFVDRSFKSCLQNGEKGQLLLSGWSLCLSAWNDRTVPGRFFVKLVLCEFFEVKK